MARSGPNIIMEDKITPDRKVFSIPGAQKGGKGGKKSPLFIVYVMADRIPVPCVVRGYFPPD